MAAPAIPRPASSSGDSQTQAERLCEIRYYGGVHALLAGDKAAARGAMRAALDTRIYHYLEFIAAAGRLALLNQP